MNLPALDSIPTDWFVCPVTKKPLHFKGEVLSSGVCDYHKDAAHGYWNFMPSFEGLFPKELWETWEHLQANGQVSYEQDPAHNLGVGPRQDFSSFADFCELHGLVLDVGCGPQHCPSHLAYTQHRGHRFVGIDPLAGEQPRSFSFVQGLAEYLPFRDHLFDQVLFVTSMDHFLNPTSALIEAKRVLKPEGEICVWIGEKDKNVPKPADSPEWYQNLKVPKLADDPFHFKRFSLSEFMGYVEAAGLHVLKKATHDVDPWRRNCFFKLHPKFPQQ
jgi:SAM-dependent methyltransferase